MLRHKSETQHLILVISNPRPLIFTSLHTDLHTRTPIPTLCRRQFTQPEATSQPMKSLWNHTFSWPYGKCHWVTCWLQWQCRETNVSLKAIVILSNALQNIKVLFGTENLFITVAWWSLQTMYVIVTDRPCMNTFTRITELHPKTFPKTPCYSFFYIVGLNGLNFFNWLISEIFFSVLRDDFRLMPIDTKVSEGDTAVLKCLPPRGNPRPIVRWTRDGLWTDETPLWWCGYKF